MGEATAVKIIETCHISPPPGSVSPIILPLTFFDFPWLTCTPMQRLFFYDVVPHPNHHDLKHSLSLALRHFFPLAAVLVSPPPPHKPHFLFSGDSSVSFTVAESTADFNRLLSDDPCDVTACHPLVPTLTRVSHETVSPLLALQVTVFPSHGGVAIGATFNHVAADGRAFNHFIKSWAFFCTTISGQDSTFVDPPKLESPPSHDRSVVLDTCGVEHVFLKQWWAVTSSLAGTPNLENKVRATFKLGQAHIEKLKQSLSAQTKASTFVATVAYTWVQLIKSEQETETDTVRDGNETYHFMFVADCRNRKGFEYPIPETYFGNCLTTCAVSLRRSEVVGENGVSVAAKAIGERVKELEGGGLIGADKWISMFNELSKSGRLVTVAGSPDLRVYDTDFGWGKPKKSQVVHTDVSGAIALAESRDEKGGIEIGLAMNKNKMRAFSALFIKIAIMSSMSRAGAWFVAATVGAVEAMKDNGFARWNYTMRSVHQHAKNNLRSYSQTKKLSSSSSAAISNKLREDQPNHSEESMRKVMYMNCWGTS